MTSTKKEPMTLHQTKEIINRWVNSCTSSEQLELLKPVIESHIVTPFKPMVPELDLLLVKEDLVNAISDRQRMIIHRQPSGVPTLDAYLN